MIPEAAVEAAVQRSWHLEITTSDVREILEAAAPHMQAEAWEQGWTAREDLHAYDVWGGGEPDSSNPYRPAP